MAVTTTAVCAPDEAPRPKSLIGVKELGRRLGISIRTIWRLYSSGQLPGAVRVGRSVRWRADEVNRWISAGCPTREAWERMNRDSDEGGPSDVGNLNR